MNGPLIGNTTKCFDPAAATQYQAAGIVHENVTTQTTFPVL